MRTLGNIIWLIMMGAVSVVTWGIVGACLCISLVGIPFGLQCFKLARFVVWPFGTEVYLSERGSILPNIIWFVLFGWEIIFIYAVLGVVWCLTIVGIPFGKQCFRFCGLAMAPFGTYVWNER